MNRHLYFATLVAAGACADSSAPPITSDAQDVVQQVRAQFNVPGMAAAVLDAGGVRDLAAIGVRRAGTSDAIAPDDRFHLGSNLKAMTATAIATVVEQGLLSWESTAESVFPELAADMAPALRVVTLAQLLNHHGGIQPFTSGLEFTALPAFSGTPMQQRAAFSAWLLEHGRAAAPGTFLYSNAGYALAAAMAERATGIAFEELLATRVFAPLGISGHAGWPASLDPSQPWGHTGSAGMYTPQDPHGVYQLRAFMAPAGDLSMSVEDYARFVLVHHRAFRGEPELLEAPTFQRMHTPQGPYAMGWALGDIRGTSIYAHEGTAGTFHAVAVIVPSRNIAAIVFVNAGGVEPATAARTAALRLVGLD